MHNRATLFGDSFFTTLRLQSDHILFESSHVSRLLLSAERLGVQLEEKEIINIFNKIKKDFKAKCTSASASSAKPSAIVRLQCCVVQGKAGLARDEQAKLVFDLQYRALDTASSGGALSVVSCATPVPDFGPVINGLKTTNALNYVLATKEWQAVAADEGLMLNHYGHVAEASFHNVFAWIDDGFWTPSLVHGGVSGIFRDQLIKLAKEQYIKLSEKPLSSDQLITAAKGLWLANSVRGMRFVSELDQKPIQYSKQALAFSDLVAERWGQVVAGDRIELC
ncbi:MAG: aminotransferase class IV [Pseudomonadota bacterium]|nr:aminotransferase class IV [Pseudomonadota bacterium]